MPKQTKYKHIELNADDYKWDNSFGLWLRRSGVKFTDLKLEDEDPLRPMFVSNRYMNRMKLQAGYCDLAGQEWKVEWIGIPDKYYPIKK